MTCALVPFSVIAVRLGASVWGFSTMNGCGSGIMARLDGALHTHRTVSHRTAHSTYPKLIFELQSRTGKNPDVCIKPKQNAIISQWYLQRTSLWKCRYTYAPINTILRVCCSSQLYVCDLNPHTSVLMIAKRLSEIIIWLQK